MMPYNAYKEKREKSNSIYLQKNVLFSSNQKLNNCILKFDTDYAYQITVKITL